MNSHNLIMQYCRIKAPMINRIFDFVNYVKVFLLVAVAFSCTTIQSGVVVSKIYEKEHTIMMMIQAGKVTTLMPVHDDKDYVLIVKGTNRRGKTVTRKFYMSERKYSMFEEGDRVIINNKDCKKVLQGKNK